MNIPFTYDTTCLVPQETILSTTALLKSEIARMHSALDGTQYATKYASIQLPFDTDMHIAIKTLTYKVKLLQPSMLVIIGIGGSNLAAKAIHEALHGTYYNDLHPEMTCYWLDTIDSDILYSVTSIMRAALMQGKKIVLLIISKSGSTLETDINAAYCSNIMSEFYPYDAYKYIVAITDHGSPLWHCAQKNKYACLEIPEHVGGRYSAMSAVGLLPLALLGIDTELLIEGARSMVQMAIADATISSAAVSAAIMACSYQNGFIHHDLFIFDPALETLGKWYRQLLAESIGKEKAHDDTIERVGFLPTVSIGSTDLHSVAQRYLAGPHDMITTFLTVEHPRDTLLFSDTIKQRLLNTIRAHTLEEIKGAIVTGTQRAYRHQALPYMVSTIAYKRADYIAQWMQLKMIETMYLGFLLGINPFDQPQVELYKKETRKILGDE